MALSDNPTLEEIVDEVERLNNLIINQGGAQTITPKTSNQTLTKGYYKGDITVKGDANLIASNILSGKSIFGVTGSATVTSLGGKKWASGTATATLTNDYTYYSETLNRTKQTSVCVNNLDFTPSVVIVYAPNLYSNLTITGVMVSDYSIVSVVHSAYDSSSSNHSLKVRYKKKTIKNGFAVPLGNSNSSMNGKTFNWIAFE